MNKRIILATCLSALTAASIAVPVFAAKTTPALGKAKTAQSMKIKCAKAGKKVSLQNNASPVVSLKKGK